MKKEHIKYIVRNITRKKKQTFFTVLTIFVSSFIILVNIAMNNGIRLNLKEGINQAISGQLTIYQSENPQMNILESRLQDQIPFEWDNKATEDLLNVVDDIQISKRIRFGSLVSYNEETSYLNIHALEKTHLLRMADLLHLNKDQLPLSNNTILLSESLANDLNCGVGDTLLLVADNINDYMSDEIAQVSGIFEEKGLATMLNYVGFVVYGFGQDIVQLNKNEDVELIINSTAKKEVTEKEIAKIEQYLHSLDQNISIASWEKTVPLLFKIVDVWKGGGYITQVLFIIFSMVILVNLISLIIHSRRKEFGTLLATGFSWQRITILICAEYMLLAIFSVFSAYILTLIIITILPDTGIYIASKDMQTALMTEYLRLVVFFKNFIYTMLLFGLTTFFSSYLSIARVKHLLPVQLINTN